MARGFHGEALRHVRMLFEAGAVGGLSDGQLLERFRARDGEAAERAFAALVERHGPMVLRACRRTLRDEHEAQDAFQATFLVLVRKAGSLRVESSLASWLHAVACHVAACARSAAARRRAHERKVAAAATSTARGGGWDDLGQVLHEEIDRLPETFRAAVVLCDLEGLTQEQAAQRLGWPAGTVRSRLARGRSRLLARLTRRGVVPSAGLLATWLTAEAATAGMPPVLANATVRAASLAATGRIAAESVSALALAQGVLRATSMTRLKLISAALLAIGAGVSGTAVLALQQAGGPTAPARADREPGGPRPPRFAEVAGTPEGPAEDPPEVIDGQRALAYSILKRAEDRLAWADRMLQKGYISRAEYHNARQEFEQARLAFERLQKPRKPQAQGQLPVDTRAEEPKRDEVSLLEAQIRAKRVELQAGEARLQKAKARETSTLLLRDMSPGALSDAECDLAKAEVASAAADFKLKQAELRLLELRSSYAKQ